MGVGFGGAANRLWMSAPGSSLVLSCRPVAGPSGGIPGVIACARKQMSHVEASAYRACKMDGHPNQSYICSVICAEPSLTGRLIRYPLTENRALTPGFSSA